MQQYMSCLNNWMVSHITRSHLNGFFLTASKKKNFEISGVLILKGALLYLKCC